MRSDESRRWDAFSPVELSELLISLDHRLGEAERGNAYVYVDEVRGMERELCKLLGEAPREVAPTGVNVFREGHKSDTSPPDSPIGGGK